MDDKQKNINKTLDAINKKYGDGTVSLGDNINLNVERIRTGITALDLVIGGGIPTSALIEFYGRESSGKSSTSLKIIASYQKQGKVCAYIDMEHSIDPVWFKMLGVDKDKLIFSQPDSLEKSVDIIDVLTRSGDVDLIIYDSLAAAVPLQEVEASAEDQQMALVARCYAKMVRKLLSALQPSDITNVETHNKTTIIFINQVREKVGVMYAHGYETPGGHALKHAYKIRVEFKAGDHIKDENTGDDGGLEINFTTKKNKTFIPYKTGMFQLYFDGHTDNEETIIIEAKKYGIIEQGGPMYSYKEYKEKGKEAFIAKMKEMKLD